MMRHSLTLLLLVALVHSVPLHAARKALVIGNWTYAPIPLRTPKADIKGMAQTLGRLGFATEVRKNLTRRGLIEAVQAFSAKIRPGDEVIFYYSGHGLGEGGKNYLIPVQSGIKGLADLSVQALPLDYLVDKLKRRQPRYVIGILDACRDTGLQLGLKGGPKGFAVPQSDQAGTLLAFATGFGHAASEGKGRYSIYTGALLRYLGQPGLLVDQVFNYTRKAVREATKHSARPMSPVETGGLEDDVYLAGLPKRSSSIKSGAAKPRDNRLKITAPPAPAAEEERWLAYRPKMVLIPGGSFRMGGRLRVGDLETVRDNELPVHRVRIKSFYLSETEVTVSQFLKFVEATGYKTEAEQGNWCYIHDGSEWVRKSSYNWKSPGFTQEETSPVVCVSWNDAQAYIRWLNQTTGQKYRLPTESEWEYAARAGGETKYSWGNDIGKNRANCDGCGSRWDNKRTAPVNSFKPNAYGLYDMHGNVLEWVQDCYHGNYKGAPADGSAWGSKNCGKRVLRGGSWNSQSRGLRSAYRYGFWPAYRYYITGFRLAKTR